MESNHRYQGVGLVSSPLDHGTMLAAARGKPAGDNRQSDSPAVFTAGVRPAPEFSSRGGNRTHTITGSRPARFAGLRTRPIVQSQKVAGTLRVPFATARGACLLLSEPGVGFEPTSG